MKRRLPAAAAALVLAGVVSTGRAAEIPVPSPHAVLPNRLTAPAALDAAPVCRPPGEAVPPDAILAARRAVTKPELAAGREGLEALADEAHPLAAACAQLELARLDLLDARLPEAAARLARARRQGLPPALQRRADFYRAEYLQRSGRGAEAEPIYRLLGGSDADTDWTSPIARAAHLRLGEANARTPEGFAAYQSRVGDGEAFGVDPARWGAPVAELAIAAGDLAAARRWLDEAREGAADPAAAALLAVRSADVLFALGSAEEARAVLRGIVGRHGAAPVGALAGVRLVQLGLAPAGDRDLRRRLERTARGGHHGLATYARGVLIPRLRKAGELDGALDLLARVAGDARAPELAPDFAEETDALLRAATGPDQGCDDVLRRLGGRRSLLLRRAGEAEPFLRVGDCLLDAGFPGPALDLYRAVARRFGAEVAPRVSLRSARAAFASGQVAAALAPADAQLRRVGQGGEVPELGAWLLLRARIAAGQGEPARVVSLLRSALEEDRVAPDEPAEVLRLLARSALEVGDPDPELHALLRRGLAATAPDAESREDSRRRDEARLHAADLHRAAGATAAARALYARAAAGLPPGPLRGRARFWQGMLAEDLDAARAAWRSGADEAPDAVWSRLAREELTAGALGEAVGRSRRAPRAAP